MVGETTPETLPEKTMADPGETTINFSDSLADEWCFLDHNTLPVVKFDYLKQYKICRHAFAGQIDWKWLLFAHKNGNKVHVKIALQGRLSQ